MIWDLYQERRISSAQAKADSAANKVDRHKSEVDQLKKSVQHLTLACQAMWELLRENTDFTEPMLNEKIQQIDLRDGTSDGKISTRPLVCAACGAKSNSRRKTCVMCGEPLARDHAFEA